MSVLRRIRHAGMAIGVAASLTAGAASGSLLARQDETSVARSRSVVEPPVTVADPAPARRPQPPVARARRDPLPSKPCGAGGRLIRYRVAVGRGVPVTKLSLARGVAGVLCDSRSWIGSDGVRFRYDPRGRVVVRLLSARDTERRCLGLIGLSVREKFSCASRARGEVVLNADRWLGGSPWWPGSVRRYRALLVNHEMGHIIGFGHAGCSARGARAPVMMQQSKGLDGCRANAWPVPAELRRL